MSLVHLNFESQCLNCNTDVNIILPDRPRNLDAKDFYTSGEKYKVLWLLHGTFGDYTDWIRKSMIELYASEKNLIVVMPSALNSFYSNWNVMMGMNFFDFLTDELMPLVHSWFPASDKREDNFISGLSMGGEGALKYAVNHPDKFSKVAVLSMYARDFEKMDPSKTDVDPRTMSGYANAGGYEKFMDSYENIRKIILEKKDTGELPDMMFACGKNDFLYKGFCEFEQWTEDVGLDSEFIHVEDFTHEWRFWDIAIQEALEFFGL